MARTRELVRRRKSIRNTRKITRTMEMIATAKFKKASDRIHAAAPYADRLAAMVSGLAASMSGQFQDPLLRVPEETKRVALLVVTGNRGLCGAYNTNVLSKSLETYRARKAEGKEIELQVSGKKGISFFQYQDVPIAKKYVEFEDKPVYDRVKPIADDFLARFRAEAFDELRVVYTRFASSSRQVVVEEVFLPLQAGSVAETAATRDYIYEPGPAEILTELLPHSFRTRLFTVFLHAAASEQVARMVAMKNATDNADEIIKSLTRMYNRARQSQITTEILEIMGAKAAMEG